MDTLAILATKLITVVNIVLSENLIYVMWIKKKICNFFTYGLFNLTSNRILSLNLAHN